MKIAKRRSGSDHVGFYRPDTDCEGGERAKCLLDIKGHPPVIENEPSVQYNGPPTGRSATDDEKRGAWQLQTEYLEGRLGKNEEENCRLWNTAKWIDRHLRIATMPAHAVKTLNLHVDGWDDVVDLANKEPEDDLPPYEHGLGYEKLNIDERDKQQLLLKLPDDYELAKLVDYFNECDKLAKIDANKLARDADPLPVRIDLPGPIDRQESIKIIRMLKLGMRSLWYPVRAAIVDHATMTALGKTRTGNVAGVGRQRVIEGLRITAKIGNGPIWNPSLNEPFPLRCSRALPIARVDSW